MHEGQAFTKPVDLSLDNIEVSHPSRPDAKSLVQENRFIRKQNEVLRKELEKISGRLDGEIRKRLDDSKRKNVAKGEDVSQMELQNAYKKCQIYRKEAQMYKKKLETASDDGRMEDFERRVSSYAKDNLGLKEEVKQLKKISKLQEKGLTELGIEGYTKIVGESQKWKEEVRILKKQVDNYRRALEGSRRQRTHTSNFEDRVNETSEERRTMSKRGDSRMQSSKLKRKMRTQQSMVESSEDLTGILHQKAEKDYLKMKTMASQKNKLRELVDNLKIQLSEKDKEVYILKEKIAELRRNNHLLQTQVVLHKSDSDLIDPKMRRQKDPISHFPKGLKSKHLAKIKEPLSEPKKKVWKKQQAIEEVSRQFDNQIPVEIISNHSSYPCQEQNEASTGLNLIKWNHQHLSSKIKQIQVLRHEEGHIKDIHVRYEKGEPKKYEQSGNKSKYQIFICTGQDEYIRHIEGAFYNHYLQYLVITSNHRRVEKYGNFQEYQGNQQAEYFELQVKDKEYPGALFGETDDKGVRKVGSFIHKEN